MVDSTSPPPAAPRLQVTGLPAISAEEKAATRSPARGAEMRNFLQARLQKNRAPVLVHSWDFYHDRQDRTQSTNLSNADPTAAAAAAAAAHASETGDGSTSNTNGEGYEVRLEKLAVIDDVRKFWNVFNNFPIQRLALRDSIHLFHKGVKPVWEDPRNARGGAWTFRVHKTQAQEVWQEVCMMAIGEQLQAAVEEAGRTTFRDDICGVWNRDGEHVEGVQGILRTVLEGLSEELRPREGSYYYKRHCEHAGFTAPVVGKEGGGRPTTSGGASIDAVLEG